MVVVLAVVVVVVVLVVLVLVLVVVVKTVKTHLTHQLVGAWLNLRIKRSDECGNSGKHPNVIIRLPIR